MAARPTWKGFLKISLVNIPIRVFPATDSAATISFNQLHARVSDAHPAEALVPALRARSADLRDRQGLRVREGPLRRRDRGRHRRRSGPSRRASSTSCSSPTMPRSIRSTSSARTTWRPTAPMAKEAFAVMREGMKGKAGIGKLALYGREYLVAVQAREKGLVMYTLRHAERNPQHGRDRGARGRAGEDQAGRDQAGEAGDRQLRRRSSISPNTRTSTRRSCSGSSTPRSPGRKSWRPRRKRRRRSST